MSEHSDAQVDLTEAPEWAEYHRRTLDLMDQVTERCEVAQPDGFWLPAGPSQTSLEVVLGLQAWCRSTFRAIKVLVAERHPEEAAILQRGLIEDSTTLVFLHKKRDRLDEYALGWLKNSIREERKHADVARRLGTPNPLDVKRFDRELSDLDDLAKNLGINVRGGLPDVADMAKAIGDPNLRWMVGYGSNLSHATRVATTSRVRLAQEGRYVIVPHGDFKSCVPIGCNSAGLFLRAWTAGGLLLGWPEINALAEEAPNWNADLNALVKEALIFSNDGQEPPWLSTLEGGERDDSG